MGQELLQAEKLKERLLGDFTLFLDDRGKAEQAYAAFLFLFKKACLLQLSGAPEARERELAFLSSLGQGQDIPYKPLFKNRPLRRGDVDFFVKIENDILLFADAFLSFDRYRKEFASSKFIQHLKSLLFAPIAESDPQCLIELGIASDLEEAKRKGEQGYLSAYFEAKQR